MSGIVKAYIESRPNRPIEVLVDTWLSHANEKRSVSFFNNPNPPGRISCWLSSEVNGVKISANHTAPTRFEAMRGALEKILIVVGAVQP